MTAAVSNHGGRREGAGRKPKPNAMVTRAFVITQDQDALLTLRASNRGISKSEYLRQVIDAEHKSKRV